MKFFCLILLSACLHQSVNAQLTREVEYPNLGISFTLPYNWYGQENESSIIATTPRHNCVLVISVHKSSLDDLEKELRNGIQDDMGTSLSLSTEEILKKDNQISGALDGVVEYNSAECYYVGLENRTGFGLSVLGVSFLGEDLDLIYSAVDSLVRSVKFSSIKSVTAGNRIQEEKGSKEMSVDRWIELLGNSLLISQDSSQSTNSTRGLKQLEEKLYLCKAGYFRFERKRSVSVNSTYPEDMSKGHGRWEIIEGAPDIFTLKLIFHDGTFYWYSLNYQEGKMYLNKSPYISTLSLDSDPNCQ